jgi:hypothetical protein
MGPMVIASRIKGLYVVFTLRLAFNFVPKRFANRLYVARCSRL